MLSSAAALAAMVAVVAAYTYFATAGRWEFRHVMWYTGSFSPTPPDGKTRGSLYANLAENFLHGHVSLAITPDPRLSELPDPYNHDAREAAGLDYLWDTSFYGGRYYLYFSPIAIVLLYVPYRLVSGAYPPDALAAAFFSTWAFLMCVAFLRRALRHSSAPLNVPLWIWIALIGFGNVVAFLLTDIRVYEVAIMTGMAMTATWAYALLRFTESPTARRAAWVGFWLALSIAARPNLAVLLVITAVAIAALRERKAIYRTAVATLIPLALIGSAVMAYNYARFRDPFEFGVKYQLTFVNMKNYKVCSLCTPGEVTRFVNSTIHYVFWAPTVGSEFPFVDLQGSRLDPAVSFPMGGELTVGVGALVPLTLVATMLAVLFVSRPEGGEPVDPGTRAALRVLAASWLILFGLSACWWVVARYALDFMMLMTVSSAVFLEYVLTRLRRAGFRMLPLRAAVISLALFTICVGFTLGFMGPGHGFKRANRELFEQLERHFK